MIHLWKRLWNDPRKLAKLVGVGIVAGVAAYNSYGHQVFVANWAHQSSSLAHTSPLSIDGMLLVMSVLIAEDKLDGRRPRWWAVFGFWFGAVVSVAANTASTIIAHGPEPISIGWTACPPVILLIVVEALSRKGKPIKNPNRVEGAKRGHANRAATPKPRSRGRRSPTTTARKPQLTVVNQTASE